jgi:glycosyltransferase involved in cell wall biosynthesis
MPLELSEVTGLPTVTVLVSAREGHFLAERSFLSVLEDDQVPFELIYVDIMSPPHVAAAITAHAATRKFKIVRHDEWIAPTLARKQALAEVRTKYVAFVDNDVLVDRGCLEKLVACAEETGAAMVCPLYLQAGGGLEPTIHMAGGVHSWSDGPGSDLIGDAHRLEGAPMAHAATLRRERIDYGEYHYILVRMDLLARSGAISDEVLLVHEHIDLALFARQQGMDVVLEPAARIVHVCFEPRQLMDVEFFRRRWDPEACEQSLHAFGRKWLKPDRLGAIEPTFGYAERRLREVSVHRNGALGVEAATSMRPGELAQTRCAFREQALHRGYSDGEIRAFEQFCDGATLLFDGLYRPDGRPFLNHSIGVASVLLRFALREEIVEAGLLHSAFTHRPGWMSEDELSATFGNARLVERIIRGQPAARAFLTRDDADLLSLNVIEVGTICIIAANEVDMLLSGEYRSTGKPPELASVALDRISEVLGFVGVDGLAESARSPRGNGQDWRMLGVDVPQASFRLDARNGKIMPV